MYVSQDYDDDEQGYDEMLWWRQSVSQASV